MYFINLQLLWVLAVFFDVIFHSLDVITKFVYGFVLGQNQVCL